MHKLISLFGVASMLVFASCGNNNNRQNEQEENSTPPPQQEQQIPPAQNQTPPPAQPKDKDGTTIKMNEDGVSYENNDGDSKNNVIISKDSTSIEIKTPK